MENIFLKNFVKKILSLLNLKNIKIHAQESGNYFDLITGDKVKNIKLNEGASATSYPYQKLICINLDYYTGDREGLEYFVLAHELRHMYQVEAIQFGWESEELLDLWKQNLECYEGSNHIGYENQPIELDANAFAELIILELFGRVVEVNCDFQKLEENMKRISKDLEARFESSEI